MKVSVACHPDLPHPLSNAPEPQPEPGPALAEALPLASERHEHGIAALAALVNHWLGLSNLSHDQLVAVAAWGIGERGMLDPATISRIRNGKQPRGASVRHLDALAAANKAIWLWKTKGQQAAWAELGPQSGWGVRQEWLDEAAWMPHPDHPEEPLCYADIAEILAGYMELPYLGNWVMSPAEVKRTSDTLVALLERTIGERGWGPREGIQRLLDAYPVTDTARRYRLKQVLIGEHSFDQNEIETELAALAEMLRQIRRLEPGRLGPGELRQELKSAHRLLP